MNQPLIIKVAVTSIAFMAVFFIPAIALKITATIIILAVLLFFLAWLEKWQP